MELPNHISNLMKYNIIICIKNKAICQLHKVRTLRVLLMQ